MLHIISVGYHLSTDYVPANDGSIMTLTGGNGTPTLNGEVKDYALLGFTNPGTWSTIVLIAMGQRAGK
jgi:hypothetical protein